MHAVEAGLMCWESLQQALAQKIEYLKKNQSVKLINLFESAAYDLRTQRSQSKIISYSNSYLRGFSLIFFHL